jgi:hypothetical protein
MGYHGQREPLKRRDVRHSPGGTMLVLNGTSYKLVGLDTGVISEILRDTYGAKKGFLELFSGTYIPCFSVYQTFELRKRREIYDQFLELFDVLPCMLLKNEDMLFEDEQAGYPSASDIDPTVHGFSLLNRKLGTNLENLMRISFENPDTVKREADWPRLKQEILDSWIEMRPNFRPHGHRFSPLDGREFVERVTYQQIFERAPEWAAEVEERDGSLRTTAFPSIRMTAWTVFFRIYMSHRKPETQDVFDTVISTPAPYLDAVVTENYQADIYGHVKRFEAPLVGLEVLRLRDLRQAGGDA